jgi:hypothetical protein
LVPNRFAALGQLEAVLSAKELMNAIAQHRALAHEKTALAEHFLDLPGLPTEKCTLGTSLPRNRSARIRASTLSALSAPELPPEDWFAIKSIVRDPGTA